MAEHLELTPERDFEVKIVKSVGEVRHSNVFLGEIPSKLYDEDELKQFLVEQLRKSIGERGQLMDNIERWQDRYSVPSAKEPKNFPFANASNLTMPVIKEAVNILFSSLAQTVITPRPRWILKDLSIDWEPFKKLIEKFLDLASERDFKYDAVLETIILEGVKMGTAVYEIGYEHIERNIYIYSEDGKKAEKRKVTVRSSPQIWPIPLEDWFIRFNEEDEQEAIWTAKRLRFNDLQMKDRVNSGLFDAEAVEKILELGGDTDEEGPESNRADNQDTEPTIREDHEVFECWPYWNLKDGDDNETLIRVYLHLKSETILGVKFNPYWHGMRPFGKFIFFPMEHQFYGEGMCSMLEDLQEEISTTHNQRMDNSSIVNVSMFKQRRGSRALKSGEPLFTGKIIEVPEMSDLERMPLGDVAPSTVQNEAITRQIVERLSGTSEANSRGTPVTRTTAGAQMALLQEQAKRVDQTIRSLRGLIGFSGNMILSLYMQFGAGDRPIRWFGKRDGEVIIGLLKLPKPASELGIGLHAAAPTSTSNKEVQQQSKLALFNLLNSMYEKFLNLTQFLAPDALPEVAGAMVSAAKRFMLDTLESFDVSSPEEVLAGLSALERVLPPPEDMGGMESSEQTAATAKIFDELDRLETILRATPGDGSGSNRTTAPRKQLREFRGEEGSTPSNGASTGTARAPSGSIFGEPGGG